MNIKNWYGEKSRKIEITSGKCVWYHTGKEAVPIRWVIIKDPCGKFATQAIFSTKTDAAPKQIIQWFIKRWQVEVTFEESRRHLGIAHPKTMVEQSNRAHNAVLVWLIFVSYNDGTRVEQ